MDKFEKYRTYPKIYESTYRKLHKKYLTPLDGYLDIDDTMEKYRNYFYVWGTNRPELITRKGLALINLDGKLDKDDISIGPLNVYNNEHNIHYLESDFKKHTKVYKERCFDPLRRYELCRSSILSWQDGDNFVPHTDVVIPTVNLRLWGANSKNVILKFDGMSVQFEPNRLYLIDTSVTHEAIATGPVYQFFIGLLPTERNIDEIYNQCK